MKRALVQDVWVTKTGCQGLCNMDGATIVIYPQGIWLQKVMVGDVEDVLKLVQD